MTENYWLVKKESVPWSPLVSHLDFILFIQMYPQPPFAVQLLPYYQTVQEYHSRYTISRYQHHVKERYNKFVICEPFKTDDF